MLCVIENWGDESPVILSPLLLELASVLTCMLHTSWPPAQTPKSCPGWRLNFKLLTYMYVNYLSHAICWGQRSTKNDPQFSQERNKSR